MPELTLEPDEHVSEITCVRCGAQFPRVLGFVYRDGDAWAVYWAELYKDHPEHPEARAVVIIALGKDWSEAADSVDHAWAQLDIWPEGDEIQMGFIDPIANLNQTRYGLPLSRDKVLLDPRKDDFLAVADKIVYGDARVAELLGTRRRGV